MTDRTLKPVACLVECIDGKCYGKPRRLTFLDATQPSYWVEKRIPENYRVTPLVPAPTDEEIRRIAEKWELEYAHNINLPLSEAIESAIREAVSGGAS